MEKEFKMTDEGLIVTVESGDRLWLPQKDAPQGKAFIGAYTQTTIQVIEKDKANILREFIASEKAKGDEQMSGITKKLEELKDVSATELDADLVKAVKDTIDKGSKQRRTTLTALNAHIEKVAMKQQLINQQKIIAIELARMTKELTDIDKALE